MEMTIFEVSWYLRGMEGLMADMMQNPQMAKALLDRITELRVFQARTFAKFGVDFLALGDDISMQTGMLMSPRMWRNWFKPRLAEVIREAKVVKPDLLVQYHTDGDCRAVIAELIEVGVDILNPVQPECMDPVALKNEYGDKLSFSGTIGTQTTMPHGTPGDVWVAVKHMAETVGKGGGLLLAPTHVLEPDVPWENVLAFVDACREFGKY
jgi:uroporphyrinogen decarboxylase